MFQGVEMGLTQFRVAGAGLFFLFVFLSGFWLGNSGTPLNSAILTIHKLIALAAVVFLVMTVYQMNQVAALGATELIAGVVTGLLFLSAIVSGGLLSIDKPMPAAVLMMHQIIPFLTLLSTAVTLYLLK
jgi:hypothetical protein